MIVHGDCLDVMAAMEPESVSAIVTDPPYGLGFMGKAWDKIGDTGRGARARVERAAEVTPTGRGHTTSAGPYLAVGVDSLRSAGRPYQAWCEAWATEAFRVAKPGAHLLAFGGTRTVHRLTSAIEDAGWEIRDMLVWGYASGFPKSANPGRGNDAYLCRSFGNHTDDADHACPRMSPDEWYALGTALKPAWEPIVMARKPLRGTVPANVGLHGTGALNIDATRIGAEAGGWNGLARTDGAEPSDVLSRAASKPIIRRTAQPADVGSLSQGARPVGEIASASALGRWPANVILTDPIFDGGIEGVVGGGDSDGSSVTGGGAGVHGVAYGQFGEPLRPGYGDLGTYSRFFLIPKADRGEREPIGGMLALRTAGVGDERPSGSFHERLNDPAVSLRQNVHPTVKPVDLMRHLVRLVTPPGGTVLDPFLGSGTTGIACEMEGFPWIGIEKEAEYVAIAEARLVGVQKGFGLSA